MAQKRDQIIGVRLTRAEKEEIEKITKNHGLSLTEFIRKAISAYQKNIDEESKEIHLGNINDFSQKLKVSLKNVKSHFSRLNSALDDLSNNFNRLNEELYLYMMVKRTASE